MELDSEIRSYYGINIHLYKLKIPCYVRQRWIQLLSSKASPKQTSLPSCNNLKHTMREHSFFIWTNWAILLNIGC